MYSMGLRGVHTQQQQQKSCARQGWQQGLEGQVQLIRLQQGEPIRIERGCHSRQRKNSAQAGLRNGKWLLEYVYQILNGVPSCTCSLPRNNDFRV